MRSLSFAEMSAFQHDQLGSIERLVAEQGGVATFKMLWLKFALLTEPGVIR
jgi:hypothetical protein